MTPPTRLQRPYRPWADEPDPGPMLVCRRPPCSAAIYHDQVMHDYLQHDGPFPLDRDSLHVDEDMPVPRRHREPQRSRWILWITLGVAWVFAAFVIGLALIQLWIALTAAPRSAPDPTAPPPASDVAGLALASTVPASSSSGPRLSGAPHDVNRMVAPIEAPSASAGAGDVGGVP